MSKDTKNDKSQIGNEPIQRCRMAYSLNNWQPVQCTLVSDQPFFYMDQECDFEEEEFLENSEDGFSDALLSEMIAMKEKMDAYDHMSLHSNLKKKSSLEDFIEESRVFATQHENNLEKETTLEEIQYFLNKSRMAKTLYSFSQDHNIELELSSQVETVSYDKKAGKIFIHPNLNLIDQALLLVQELRRCWQDFQGAMVNPLTLHPDEAVLMNRAQKADLAVAVIRCAWEMKLGGAEEIWARVESSSLSDLGRSLAREALVDFRTLNNGKASSAVFETWFLSERSRHEDKNLIQGMLADHRGYLLEDKELSQINITNLICKLGAQPFGKNYLVSYAQMIINDGLFTEVRDRSNANFLWFIKFERNFQEAEQELQSSKHIKMAGIDQSKNKNIIEDNQNESGFTNSDQGPFSREVFVGQDAPKGNNVIEIQFGTSANHV